MLTSRHLVWRMEKVVQAQGKVCAGAEGFLREAGIAGLCVYSVSSI